MREDIQNELKKRREARALRERTFIMGATNISDEEMNGGMKEVNQDPVDWAKKFFESNEFKGMTAGKQKLKESEFPHSPAPEEYAETVKEELREKFEDLANLVGMQEAIEFVKTQLF